MTDVTSTIDAYFAMWNETDPRTRAHHIERAWADDGHYQDPQLDATGAAALGEMVKAVQTRFPGQTFRRLSGIDRHHDQIRFAWDLVTSDGTVTVTGLDVGEVGPDGRLRRIVGFFGDLPPKA